MELKKILVGLEGIKAKGNVDLEIQGIEKNSKEVLRPASITKIMTILLTFEALDTDSQIDILKMLDNLLFSRTWSFWSK